MDSLRSEINSLRVEMNTRFDQIDRKFNFRQQPRNTSSMESGRG